MAAVLTRQLLAYDGDEYDEEKKYNFVVALHNNANRVPNYRCTGTLISPNWVLTSANCLVANTQMQFEEMELPINDTNSIRQIIRMERPPISTSSGPDLGLMFVKAVPMKEYGQLSAVDYKSIIGHAATYVGFGPPKEKCSSCAGPMHIREGAIVSSCNPDKQSVSVPVARLCIAPKCSELERWGPGAGDPGSPMFHADKLAGVHNGDESPHSMRTYTPISPYLTWINLVLSKPEESIGQKIKPETI